VDLRSAGRWGYYDDETRKGIDIFFRKTKGKIQKSSRTRTNSKMQAAGDQHLGG
jgi:hypothetical protein